MFDEKHNTRRPAKLNDNQDTAYIGAENGCLVHLTRVT